MVVWKETKTLQNISSINKELEMARHMKTEIL